MLDVALPWIRDTVPDWELGGPEAPDAEVFSDIRGIVGLPDGGVVVLDGGAAELRWFGSTGAHLRTRGGRGRGPAEFTSPRIVPRFEKDSVLLVDRRTLVQVAVDGSSIDRVPSPEIDPTLLSGGPRAAAGSAVVYRITLRSMADCETNAPCDFPSALRWVDFATGEARTLAEFAGRWLVYAPSGGPITTLNGRLDQAALVAPVPGGFVVEGESHYGLRRFDETGSFRMIMRLSTPTAAVTDQTLAPDLERSTDPAATRRLFDMMAFPEVVPAFRALLVDPLGMVWAERFRLDDSVAPEWLVFDSAGRAHGVVRLPTGHDLQVVGEDHVMVCGQTPSGSSTCDGCPCTGPACRTGESSPRLEVSIMTFRSFGRLSPAARLAIHAGVALAGLLLATPVLGQDSRDVSGVVVDAQSGEPVADAEVSIAASTLGAVSDEAGRFQIAGVPLGEVQVVVRHLAYGQQSERLVLTADGPADVRILISGQAIELEAIGVEVTGNEAFRQRSLGTAANVIDRADIEAFGPQGEGVIPLLQSRIPSLKVQGGCVEYRVFQNEVFFDPENPESLVTVPCRDITVYADGMPQPAGSDFLRQLNPQDVERIQVLSPAEAGVQYAQGNRGVVLVEMRQGVASDSPYRIHVTGFEWNEPGAYPWLRMLGGAALGNAAVVGLATTALLDCGGTPDPFGELPRCHARAGLAAAALTGVMAPVIARVVGKTDYSEGRTYPTLLAGVAMASLGYMLYVNGSNEGSDAKRTAGQVVLAVGIPISLTFTNRVFRMLR
ncbi:carboxypeptidase-like regulatory domain-containing protein [Gaopeijia maritima]|uniref:carboxypeptidase-like regulatory domain-containing protein n=1 Tax=Gaopeijia maritima TaxID=3119007 RepID=UPI00324D4CBF